LSNNERKVMKRAIIPILFATALLGGCEQNTPPVDTIPPFEPRGIYTQTGDGYVRLFWLSNQEPDVAGYRIYVSNAFDGVYQAIGETPGLTYSDYEATNGITAYYAITAFDGAGNESGLSKDLIYDTPRPEGVGVAIPNYHIDPARAGYDFSTYSIGPFDDQYTDFFFEFFEGMYYLNVWEDTWIQDMGYTTSLAEIAHAPTAGWSPTGDVRLIPGHTYVVKTWDNHYAKVRVRSLSDTYLVFDWAYQLQPGNTRLKQAITRGVLTPSKGFISRAAASAGQAGATGEK
jgi:hypothetical protein